MKRIGTALLVTGMFLLIQAAQAANWGASQRLTANAGFSSRPAIAADALGNLHVVW